MSRSDPDVPQRFRMTDQQYCGRAHKKATRVAPEQALGRRTKSTHGMFVLFSLIDAYHLRSHLSDALSLVMNAPSKVRPLEFLAA